MHKHITVDAHATTLLYYHKYTHHKKGIQSHLSEHIALYDYIIILLHYHISKISHYDIVNARWPPQAIGKIRWPPPAIVQVATMH